MAKKKAAGKKAAASKSKSQIRSFGGMIKGRDRRIQILAKAVREVVMEELGDAVETFHTGKDPLAMFRTEAEVCWIQPFTKHCNLYFTRGTELSDPDGQLKGTSKRFRHVQLRDLDDIDSLPIRDWLRESIQLNAETVAAGISFDEVMERLREISESLPQTKETITWGKPHFRVKEKIFCGCGESNGKVSLGLKMESRESNLMMKLPGITKAPYSRPNDGWVSIDPAEFDDWDEIRKFVIGSYCLIAPKRLVALIDE